MAAATSVDNVPVTYSQAMKRPDKDSWKEAFDAEWNAINGNDIFEYVALPEGKKPINCRWVLTIKDGGQFRARLVANGLSQVEGIDYNETFAPVIRYDQVPGKVLKLKKSIYGLKQAPLVWNQNINGTLEKIGFIRNSAELGLYHKNDGDKTIILGLYVDDILLASNDGELLKQTKNLLMETYKMKDLGKVKKFLGLNIKQSEDHTIKLSLEDYISNMTEELGMRNAMNEQIPASVGQALTGYEVEQSSEVDETQYRSIVGKLLFAANVVRYDISYIVGVLSRNLQNPKKIHLNAAKKVVRYLKSSENFAITYRKSNLPLQGFADADYANDLTTRRSTTGFIFKRLVVPLVGDQNYKSQLLCQLLKQSLWLLQKQSKMDYG
jgi:hypothetical protein